VLLHPHPHSSRISIVEVVSQRLVERRGFEESARRLSAQVPRGATLRKVINGKTYRSHTAQLIVRLPTPFQKPLTDGTTLVCIGTNGAHIFWQEKAGRAHVGRKTLRAGRSQAKALSPYPKTKHAPTRNMPDCRPTGLHGLGLHGRRAKI
jgi:hypothetical protein